MGIVISIMIVAINYVLGIAIGFLSGFIILKNIIFTSFEKYHIITRYNISYAKKTSFVDFYFFKTILDIIF